MRYGKIQFRDDADFFDHIRACEKAVFESLAGYVAGMPSNSDRAAFLGRVQKKRGAEFAQRLRAAAWARMRSAA